MAAVFSLCETRDPEEGFRDLVRSLGWIRNFSLSGPEDAFRVRRRTANLGPVGFFHGSNSGYSLTAGMGDKLVLVMPTRGHCGLKSGSFESIAEPGKQAVFTPLDSFTAQLEPGIEGFMLSVNAQTLAQRCGQPTTGNIASIDISRGPGWLLSQAAHLAGMSLVQAKPGPLALSTMGDLLLNLMAEALVPQAAGPAAPAAVRRAMEFMDARCLDALTLDEIAAQAGVSVRRLQSGFRSHLGTTPLAWLKQRRLQAAREMLRAPGNGSVTDVAGRCGFGHMSEFARAYREAFGELPSETLRSRL